MFQRLLRLRWKRKTNTWNKKINKSLPALLEHWKKDITSEEEISHYTARASFGKYGYRDKQDSEYRRIYWDTKEGIILQYQERYIAGIGFTINDSVITIKQIQGVYHCFEELKKIKWERLLISLVTQIAKDLNLKGVRIVPAEDNKWYNKQREKIFKMRYNVTAERLGFVLNKEERLYKLVL